MINCPKCGAANRRGSRFCNECGELLPSYTALACPMCGALNPINNAYCDQCNARIVPMQASDEEADQERSPIKGLSLPTIPLEQKDEQPTGQEVESAESEDWLAQLRDSTVTGTESSTEETETRVEEEADDWLAQLRASADEMAEPEPDRADEPVKPVEIPDWLQDLGPIGAEAKAAQAEEQPAAEAPPAAPPAAPALDETKPIPTPAEVPDWLQETAPAEAAAEGALDETKPIPTPAEVPDWLQEVAPAEVAAEAAPPAAPALDETAPTPAPAEVPDWLQEIAPAEAAAEAAPALDETAPAPAPAEVPDWLQEIAPAEATAEAAPPTAPVIDETAPAPAPAEVPDWLQEIAPAEVAAEAAPPTAPVIDETAPTPAPAEVPDWLQEIAPAEAAAEAAPGPPPSVSPLLEFPEGVETAESPEWLTELQREAPPVSGPPPPAFADMAPGEGEGLARAEIPAWLQSMRPRTEEPQAAVTEEPQETEGLLEGLRGVLAPAPVTEMLQTHETALPPEAREASLARAQLLQSILTRPTETPQPAARKHGISRWERIQRWIVAIALLAPILTILIWPLMMRDPELPPLTQPDRIKVEALAKSIEGVRTSDTVLIAFEYGPAEADELDLVAGPILNHLHNRGATITVASTKPEGLAVAATLQSDIASQGHYTPTYQSSDYLPGGATGVAQLLTSTDTRPTLVLILAAQPASLRWWIEQVHVWNKDIPLLAGVSASLEPIARPYQETHSGQLDGLVVGLRGAADYEAHQGTKGQAIQQLDALAAGHIVIIGLMLVGAIIHALDGSRRREE